MQSMPNIFRKVNCFYASNIEFIENYFYVIPYLVLWNQMEWYQNVIESMWNSIKIKLN